MHLNALSALCTALRRSAAMRCGNALWQGAAADRGVAGTSLLCSAALQRRRNLGRAECSGSVAGGPVEHASARAHGRVT
jgi:hypothetical protein